MLIKFIVGLVENEMTTYMELYNSNNYKLPKRIS